MFYLTLHDLNAELVTLRESEDRARQQHAESMHREKVLVRRLATKEQEMQEYVSQISEFKAAQAPGAAALRSALLDPAVNLLLQRLRQELVTTRARLEETQNELSAWKFTPDSNTGKRLMAKCRLLYQENEELGRMISSGRMAKLEGDLALQKSFSEEVKKSQSELDEFLQELDEDVEGMQSTIYYLQQELRKAKDTVQSLQQENNSLKNGCISSIGNELQSQQGVGNSGDVGQESRTRTPPSCHNGVQEKGEEDSRGWEERTQGSDRVPSPHKATDELVGDSCARGEASAATVPLHTEEDSVSCDVRTPEHSAQPTSPLSQNSQRLRTFDELDESANMRPHSPPAVQKERQWPVNATNDDTSSDSTEIILKLEADDIADVESESPDPQERRVGNSSASELRTEQKTKSPEAEVPSSRKRTCPSDDSSNDSDNIPLIKKVRRDSEISLHYNEDDDETGLTNGETTLDNGK
ncbi:pre-mRNA-splicing regulator female-lethal(2)D isoform X2 [Anabrus simplex]|uniref:pre-mRNA-splicing regulator female-lethal(2)D isoform X2 n=1 Tax=Anabrus simplex TaxID=316456 RepID=UPI0034DCFCDB